MSPADWQLDPTFRKMPGLTDTRTEERFGQAPAHLQHSLLRPKGYVVITDPTFGDSSREGETTMCVHCQYIWMVEPGSGAVRGFCLRCNGPTCGKEQCETACVPFEKMLEEIERAAR